MTNKVSRWWALFVVVLFPLEVALADEFWDELNSNVESFYQDGNYVEAAGWAEMALLHARSNLGERHPKTLRSTNNLAAIYMALGRHEDVEALFVTSIAFSRQVLGDQHPDTLASVLNLASLYDEQGRYEEAESLQVEALTLSRQALGERHPLTLAAMNNLAGLYESQKRYVEAEPLYVETLALSRQVLGDQHQNTLISMNNLARLYQRLGRYAEAEPLHMEALSKSRQVLGDKHPKTLSIMHDVAELYERLGRHKKAESLYVEVLFLSREVHGGSVFGDKHGEIRRILNDLARFYFQAGFHEKAEFMAQKAWSATQAFWGNVLWGASEKTREAYIQKHKAKIDLYLSVFSQRATEANARRALALSLGHKGLLLQLATHIRGVSHIADDPELKRLATSLADGRARLSALIMSGKASPADIKALEDDVNRLQLLLGRQVQVLGNIKRLDQQSGKLDRQLQQWERNAILVSPEQLIAGLDEQSVFVDYLVYRPYAQKADTPRQDEHLLALVVSKQADATVQLLSLGELAPLRLAIEQYRHALKSPVPLSGQDKVVAQKLYQSLWAPLLPHLKDKQQVYVAPDGVLNLLPFGSLVDENGRYLIENHALTLLSSGRDLVLPPLVAQAAAPVIVAAPLYDASQAGQYAATGSQRSATTTARAIDALYFSPLPGALKEGDALQTQLSDRQQTARYYKLGDATESVLSQVVSPRILHLATHGFFLEDLPKAADEDSGKHRGLDLPEAQAGLPEPEAAGGGNPLRRSGLALVDANLAIKAANDDQYGILTAEEVLDLQLAGTELVVLSACETGVGKIQNGEGVYGLRRAFQEAGAQAVLSTLWSISDEGTQHFMARFYQRFLEGEPPQQALRQTQLEFMKSDAWGHPFYWAPFVMVGKQ